MYGMPLFSRKKFVHWRISIFLWLIFQTAGIDQEGSNLKVLEYLFTNYQTDIAFQKIWGEIGK